VNYTGQQDSLVKRRFREERVGGEMALGRPHPERVAVVRGYHLKGGERSFSVGLEAAPGVPIF